MTTSLPSGVDFTWQDNPDRNCRGNTPDDWFPTEVDPKTKEEYEPPYPPPRQKNLCLWCPVRPECLAFAIATDQPAGIWGGLSTYERQLINRPKERKHCLSCGSVDVVTEYGNEVCLACGTSWAII